MDREILFAKTLEQVRKQGKIQGNRIGKEQVREAFAELSLEESQLEKMEKLLILRLGKCFKELNKLNQPAVNSLLNQSRRINNG